MSDCYMNSRLWPYVAWPQHTHKCRRNHCTHYLFPISGRNLIALQMTYSHTNRACYTILTVKKSNNYITICRKWLLSCTYQLKILNMSVVKYINETLGFTDRLIALWKWVFRYSCFNQCFKSIVGELSEDNIKLD